MTPQSLHNALTSYQLLLLLEQKTEVEMKQQNLGLQEVLGGIGEHRKTRCCLTDG